MACTRKDLGFQESETVYYPRIHPDTIQPNLPPEVSESSGIIRLNGKIWTLNDSGNGNYLYELDENSGELLRSVQVKNGGNFDWEALAKDNTHAYIGDIGNNNGLRRELRIYRFPLSELADPLTFEIRVDTIRYALPDYPKSRNPLLHNRDCEALIAFEDSLYIFTKNRGNEFTDLYGIPNVPGVWIANYKGSYEVIGEITAASLDSTHTSLALLGYRYHPFLRAKVSFVWLFRNFPRRNFFAGKAQRWDLEARKQTEGITWVGGSPDRWWISYEKGRGIAPGLFELYLPIDAYTVSDSLVNSLIHRDDQKNDQK